MEIEIVEKKECPFTFFEVNSIKNIRRELWKAAPEFLKLDNVSNFFDCIATANDIYEDTGKESVSIKVSVPSKFKHYRFEYTIFSIHGKPDKILKTLEKELSQAMKEFLAKFVRVKKIEQGYTAVDMIGWIATCGRAINGLEDWKKSIIDIFKYLHDGGEE